MNKDRKEKAFIKLGGKKTLVTHETTLKGKLIPLPDFDKKIILPLPEDPNP